ncbi:MAG: aminopeptidase [Clostridia bacterium]|nr:aminopeptidase [Clostridia bacterium]
MKDPRIQKLAYNLINYSCSLKKGEKILIEAFGIENALVKACVEEARKIGAYPFVTLRDHAVVRAMVKDTDEEHQRLWAKYDAFIMQDMDAYLGIRGGENSYELSDIPAEKSKLYDTIYGHPVHHEIRVKNTKWCVLRYPTPSMAQLSGMSTEAFEDFYYDVCTLDYSKMDRAMDALKALMDRTDKVRLVARDTDLTFSIKGIGSENCAGEKNIPDGEIYSAPVKNSVNGVITYNAPSINKGLKFENVRFEFKDGKIVNATANYTEKLNEILNVDEGARYVGEFAIGVNPFINKPMGDILFDEKIAGSIHFTPGACYDDCYNGNVSALHWDLVLIMTPEYGGGEIWFDDVLIRKDGMFVLDELKALNPENLK